MFISKGRFGIKLVPFGRIPGDILDFLTDEIQDVFRKKVFRLRPQKIPIEAFDLNRTQYSVKELLEYINSLRVYKEKMLGIINEDIYKKNFPFVFGAANPIKESAVVSTWRFAQNMRYFDCDPELFKMRLKKQAIHELSYTYGLRHCSNPDCIMFYSFTMNELDQKSDQFCDRCKSWF